MIGPFLVFFFFSSGLKEFHFTQAWLSAQSSRELLRRVLGLFLQAVTSSVLLWTCRSTLLIFVSFSKWCSALFGSRYCGLDVDSWHNSIVVIGLTSFVSLLCVYKCTLSIVHFLKICVCYNLSNFLLCFVSPGYPIMAGSLTIYFGIFEPISVWIFIW